MKSEKWREAIGVIEATIVEMHEKERRRNMPAKILLVDDDPNDVCLLCRLLDAFNCDVKICRDPEEAEAALISDKFDFAFLDQKMPKISGLEILRKTMPMASGTQFFMVSGFQDSQIVSETLKLGALYLPKPVTRKLLATFLRPKNE